MKVLQTTFMCIAVALISCQSNDDSQPFKASTDPADEDSNTSSTEQNTDSTEVTSDSNRPTPPTTDNEDIESDEVCADWNIALDNRPANVMLLEDVSASMVQDENLAQIPPGEPSKWSFAKAAITALVSLKGDEINFGLDIFSNAPFENDPCSVRSEVLVDSEPDNADPIISALDEFYPKGKTPLYLAMERYLDASHAPLFMSEDGRPFLVIVSDGKDTCDPDGPDETGREDGASVFQLGDLSESLRDEMGISTIVIGFGDGVDPDQLNAVAKQGGTEFTSYLVAQDADELETAFNEIAWSVIGCEYSLGEYDPQTIDLEKVNFLFDGKKVEQDAGCKTEQVGWTWANDEKSAVEFCTAACNMLKNHEVNDISAVIGCPDIAPVK